MSIEQNNKQLSVEELIAFDKLAGIIMGNPHLNAIQRKEVGDYRLAIAVTGMKLVREAFDPVLEDLKEKCEQLTD